MIAKAEDTYLDSSMLEVHSGHALSKEKKEP